MAGQRSSLVHGALGEEPGGARSPVFFLSGSHGRGLFTGIPGSRHSLPFSPHGRCLRQSPGARRARPGHEVSAVGLPRAPPAAPSPLPPEDRGLGDVSITSAPSSHRTTAPSCPTRGRKTSTRTALGTPVTTMTTTTASRTRRWAAPVPRALLALRSGPSSHSGAAWGRSPPWSAQGLPRTGSAHGGGRSAQERPGPFPPPPPTPLPPRAQGLPCTRSTGAGRSTQERPGLFALRSAWGGRQRFLRKGHCAAQGLLSPARLRVTGRTLWLPLHVSQPGVQPRGLLYVECFQ